ncbi:unnamed protein product [Amaranthus hypochondriacus]
MNRPRVVIDGIRRTRTYRFFWCRNCDRTVRVASNNPSHNSLCPICYQFLWQELHILRPNSSNSAPSTAQLLDTIAQFINPHESIIPRPVSLHENAANQVPLSDRNTENQTDENTTNSMMPIIRVKSDTFGSDSDSTCPVCKEDFAINEEIRKLNCNHYYHSDCIIPWLRINNTCPVCRYQLPINRSSNNHHNHNNNDLGSDVFGGVNYGRNRDYDDVDYDFRLEDVFNLSWPSWAELLSLLWPFRLSSLLDWSLPD